jgi:hypothetical protein
VAAPGIIAAWTAADIADLPPIDFRDPAAEALRPYRQRLLARERLRYQAGVHRRRAAGELVGSGIAIFVEKGGLGPHASRASVMTGSATHAAALKVRG